jgi:DNA-binding MarR family transcriptional regulator
LTSTPEHPTVTKITHTKSRPPRGPDSPPLTRKIEELSREMRLMSSFDALFSQAVAERVGMHATDIETMDLLNTLGPMTAGELAGRTGLSSGATTRLIDRMERAGYVRRRADEHDRRCVIVEPVEENLGEIGACFQPLADGLIALWSTFNDRELDVIIEFLRRNNAVVAAMNARMRGHLTGEACE